MCIRDRVGQVQACSCELYEPKAHGINHWALSVKKGENLVLNTLQENRWQRLFEFWALGQKAYWEAALALAVCEKHEDHAKHGSMWEWFTDRVARNGYAAPYDKTAFYEQLTLGRVAVRALQRGAP